MLPRFKEPGARDRHLEFSRFAHRPAPDRVAAIADRVHGWLRLAATPARERHVTLVLSTYPGKDWNMGHAVGLDAPASAHAILEDLRNAGYDVSETGHDLSHAMLSRNVRWPLDAYRAALAKLPDTLRNDLETAWGAPETDPDVEDGAFRFAALWRGKSLIALQPERGMSEDRADGYHDLSRTPRHAYVAFYLWLQMRTDAMVHIGAHGTLEWLPGKSVALSGTCWPEVLVGDLPVIYPFIVNDPGEAAQAKRRIGAVTLGHIPPPLRQSGTPERLARLEALLDEFSNADGLDPRRRDRLQGDIRAEAQSLGVEHDLGLDRAACPAEAITRIDRFVCDVKDSQFGDGLHVWGRPVAAPTAFETATSTTAERQSLLDALDGRRIEAGPSGSPYRGRTDVLPTGRNIYTTDPRSVPTRSAYAQGVKLAGELVRRHLQDEGDWPRGLIVDLWGSATMRTAGEEFAMALHLLGVRPVWDEGSERVSGIEVLPITDLDRPRIDVTLRVSGLFRDVFPTLSVLFGQAIRALAERDEAPDWNPYAGRADLARVYGPAPGSFGLGMGHAVEDYSAEGRQRAGEAWLKASAWALDGGEATRDEAGLRDRVSRADSFVHLQDLPETDLLLAADYAAHEAGFAAAQAVTGGRRGALSSRQHRPGAPPGAGVARGDRARRAGSRREPRLDRGDAAAWLPGGGGDRGDARPHGGLRASGGGCQPTSLRSLSRRDARGCGDGGLPARCQSRSARGDAGAVCRTSGGRAVADPAEFDPGQSRGAGMTAAVKGWCPGAYRPMMSGDGLVVRIRPRLARLERDHVLALCDLAQRYGSGIHRSHEPGEPPDPGRGRGGSRKPASGTGRIGPARCRSGDGRSSEHPGRAVLDRRRPHVPVGDRAGRDACQIT